jgi:cephalosporin-C deacetylase-like acetyl esterase
MRKFSLVLSLIVVSLAMAQQDFSLVAARFNYDQQAALDVKEIKVEQRGAASVHDITYASPKGGRVPAYLVVPAGKGPFAAILWGHWMMPGSASANRGEFLEEAVSLAQAGAVSLMIDAPMVRPGFNRDANPLSPQWGAAFVQEVVDLRRGLDLLLARRDVDPKRVAYVGHSFGANAGAALASVDKRPVTLVLMGRPASVREVAVSNELPRIVAMRQQMGEENFHKYLEANDWMDPIHYASHIAPAAVFFQYAKNDEFLTAAMGQHYYEAASQPKAMKLYEGGHGLNAAARRDRDEWLRTHVRLGKLPADLLEKIPETK